MLMTVLAFLVTIGVLVIIHEYGHYRAAVACNVKVLRFSVGFGRVLWSKQRGETEFVVSMLPLGGYVKMLDAREGPVDAADQHRAFNNKPLRQRAFVVAAGPMANLLLAIVLYTLVNWAGVQELRPWMAQPQANSMASQAGLRGQDEIVAARFVPSADASVVTPSDEAWVPVRSMTDVQWLFTKAALNGDDLSLKVHTRSNEHAVASGDRELRLPLSRISAAQVDGQLMERIGLTGPYTESLVGEVVAGGPADTAGLRAGDRVLTINGKTPHDAGELRQLIRSSQENGQALPVLLQVERAGQSLSLTLRPVMKDVQGKQLPRIEAMLGTMPAMVEVRYGLLEGLSLAVSKTWDMSRLSLSMLGKMVIGQASIKNLSGPLTIADYAGRSAELGWVHYLGFLALVSVSLGILNLLPLPVLDGGHLMYYLFEGVTGQPVSEQWLERLQRGGIAIMLVMMSLALYNDLARLFGAH